MKIHCTGCKKEVEARLTDGKEIYPHRQDLYSIPFWKCDTCGAYVGCHYKTNEPTKPLGYLATKELMNARKMIHAILDPLWKDGKMPRGKVYAHISHELGYTFHSGELKDIEEARKVYRIIQEMK